MDRRVSCKFRVEQGADDEVPFGRPSRKPDALLCPVQRVRALHSAISGVPAPKGAEAGFICSGSARALAALCEGRFIPFSTGWRSVLSASAMVHIATVSGPDHGVDTVGQV